VSACGARVLDEWAIISTLLVRLRHPFAARTALDSLPLAQAVLQSKASSVQSKEVTLFTFQLLCTRLGPAFEPYMLLLMPTILASISDTQAAIREAAEAAALAVASNIAAQGVSLIMSPVLEAMGDRHAIVLPRTRTAAQLLTARCAGRGRRRKRACSWWLCWRLVRRTKSAAPCLRQSRS